MLGYFICFIIGFFVGMIFTRLVDLAIFREAKFDKKSFYDLAMSKDSMRFFMGIVVMLVFLIGIITEIFDRTYQVNLALYGIIGAMIGYFYPVISKKDKDDK